MKSVVYDPVTGKLTVVGADTKEYTIPMPKEMPEYSLEVTKEGKVILKKNGTEVSSGNITFPDDPVIPTYEEFDPAKLTMNDKGEVLYNGKKTGVTIPATPTPTSSIVAIKMRKVLLLVIRLLPLKTVSLLMVRFLLLMLFP